MTRRYARLWRRGCRVSPSSFRIDYDFLIATLEEKEVGDDNDDDVDDGTQLAAVRRANWRCDPTEPGPLTVGTVKPIYRTGSPQECRGGNSPTRSPSNVSFCQISLFFFFSVKQGNIYVTICGTCVIFYFILLSFWKVWFRKQELVRVVQIKFLVDFPRSSSSLCLIASWPERCLSFTVLPVSTSVPDPLRSAFIFLLLFLYDWLILLTCHM